MIQFSSSHPYKKPLTYLYVQVLATALSTSKIYRELVIFITNNRQIIIVYKLCNFIYFVYPGTFREIK